MFGQVDESLDQISDFIEVSIERSLGVSILPWWNDGFRVALFNGINQGIAVVDFFSDEHFKVQTIPQRLGLRNIRSLAGTLSQTPFFDQRVKR